MTSLIRPGADKRERATGRLRGGPHLTTFVSFLAFAAVANAIGGGVRVLDGDSHHVHSVRFLISLAATVLLIAWAVARVRVQWNADALTPAPLAIEDERPERHRGRRPGWFRWGRWALMAALVAVAALTIASQWNTLDSALGRLGHLHWRDVRWAIYAEALAMIAFAQLTRLLLRTANVNLRLGSMIGLTLASNAMALTLPGGPAWAVTFSFDQLRRRGVHRALTAYALTVTWVLSAAALVALALVGIDLAGSTGPAAPFRVIASICTVALGAAAVGMVLVVRLPRCRAAVSGRVGWMCASSRYRRLGLLLQKTARDLRGVRLGPGIVLRCVAASILNWIYDCGCLVFSILAVGGHVPWQGVLASYGLTQLAAALPITPGGIGVVEGTLSVLLIAYHMPASTAIAGVMLYRIISFWVLVPVGWGAVASLVAMQRRGRAPTAWAPRPARVAQLTPPGTTAA